jgi:hypothetical protein
MGTAGEPVARRKAELRRRMKYQGGFPDRIPNIEMEES